ncbi:beta-phosphoglucomutase [Mycoplasmopsis pulmonis]|uniref:beta-phosphoglucomutase n=1 Tax=Mycoplasmopsis pulmonis TaxID=2107 RepID=UPI0002FF99E7|nr:beta-phosphoglucomutase [Mycoplasmopsis pulmonis]MDZ7293563.1 beta-phosphoglucomutase [Mycoplasmopsis pulmonis]VEU68397.1 beta-phosphoglucomutase (beta-PGM) domain-containing protein [Mycoplasmopsis pulmonis]
MIKAIIFDLDGVIVETASLHFLAWKHEVAKLGINFTKEQNTSLKGLNRIDTLKAILKLHNYKLSDEKIEEIAQSKNQYYQRLLDQELNSSTILPNIKNFLDQAKKNNLKLALASSSHNAKFILKKVELLSYFDFIVNPSEIKNGKPNPEIFLKALEGLNLKASEAIGIEDALAGIYGLRQAKIFAIAISNGENENWSEANLVLNTTKELDLDKILKSFS